MKYTKGPWHVNAISKGRIVGDHTAAAAEKYFICNHNATVASVYRPADALLIAAAPGLLEAARAWANVGYCVRGYGRTERPDCQCDWHLCIAAVLRAEGRP